MNLSPLQDYIVCELLPDAPKSSTLVVISTPGRAQKARILAVGPEVRDLRVGMEVIVSRLAGMDVQDKVILREESVLATTD